MVLEKKQIGDLMVEGPCQITLSREPAPGLVRGSRVDGHETS